MTAEAMTAAARDRWRVLSQTSVGAWIVWRDE